MAYELIEDAVLPRIILDHEMGTSLTVRYLIELGHVAPNTKTEPAASRYDRGRPGGQVNSCAKQRVEVSDLVGQTCPKSNANYLDGDGAGLMAH